MPLYEETTIDERGPEPLIRARQQVTNDNLLIRYKILREDVSRIHGFTLESLALKFFFDEDLAWIFSDVNDDIKSSIEYEVGDIILIPSNWERIARENRRQQTTGRTRSVASRL